MNSTEGPFSRGEPQEEDTAAGPICSTEDNRETASDAEEPPKELNTAQQTQEEVDGEITSQSGSVTQGSSGKENSTGDSVDSDQGQEKPEELEVHGQSAEETEPPVGDELETKSDESVDWLKEAFPWGDKKDDELYDSIQNSYVFSDFIHDEPVDNNHQKEQQAQPEEQGSLETPPNLAAQGAIAKLAANCEKDKKKVFSNNFPLKRGSYKIAMPILFARTSRIKEGRGFFTLELSKSSLCFDVFVMSLNLEMNQTRCVCFVSLEAFEYLRKEENIDIERRVRRKLLKTKIEDYLQTKSA